MLYEKIFKKSIKFFKYLPGGVHDRLKKIRNFITRFIDVWAIIKINVLLGTIRMQVIDRRICIWF